MRTVRIGSHSVASTEVLQTYWRFAAERQRVYHGRVAGASGPWTDDPILSQYRFTNAYRAADRVSQDLIRIVYEGSQQPEDILVRTLIYRFFNKPSTWRVLQHSGEIDWSGFDVGRYSRVLDEVLKSGKRIYSAAYIVPPPPFGAERKHVNHLRLIEHMMCSGLAADLARARSLQEVFDKISAYPSLGPFLAYQLTIDLNYTTLLDFDEDDFVVPGPGARSGIAKCFPDLGTTTPEQAIRWMVDTQEEQLAQLDLEFEDLFGRRLKLIDCQNLFCETDKYARVAHPTRRGVGNRTRIKQQFSPQGSLVHPFFPPKWGINGAVEQVLGPRRVGRQQLLRA
ncbi:nucleotide kinase domain-containing protein [Kribbella kalugense]|uniref:5-hmdU DNA kinase helical domain-containing protein n=1 Tax=Kribbella kalugense TaxID=2512221 RepID=A0A4R8A3E6_9ACTN|nr:nucleotide kinase domain-containing protein [Kribbella kalugense]TDW24161.1 hypothetical protein EV650_3027 [Kribbella kalugense]